MELELSEGLYGFISDYIVRHYLVTERFFLIFKLLLLTLTQQT